MKIVRSLITGILGSFFILLTGCASLFQFPNLHTEIKPSEYGKEFSAEELKQDLKFMVQMLETVHPDLYAYTDKRVIEQSRERIERDLTKPLTRIQFYTEIAPLVAQLGDGHTNVIIPTDEFVHFRTSGGLAFPCVVTYENSCGVTISRNYTSDTSIAVGDRILSINGRSADSLFSLFVMGSSGEREAFRRQRAARQFRLWLWIHNITPPYDIEFMSTKRGQINTTRLEGVTQSTVLRVDSLQAGRTLSVPNYVYKRLDGGIGYIDFRSMVDLPAFKAFVVATFKDIQRNPVLGLIIDLRNNGGGNSQLGNELLSYIIDSSYQMAARKEWRMSSQYKSYLRGAIPWWLRWFPFTWVSAEARKFLDAEDGEVVVSTFDRVSPEPNPLRFRGKVCFLIGSGTFSSAMMLANAVGDSKLVTLIGEETGGIPNSFGEVYSFDLPNTKLQVGVSSARFVRANGIVEDRRGVLPDIEVHSTDEDVRQGIDTVLEYAKRWMTKEN